MNVKRFTARTSRDALALVRQAFGDDAVVMSTRPCAEGVEVLAMAPESIQQLERVRASAESVRAAPAAAQPPQATPAPPSTRLRGNGGLPARAEPHHHASPGGSRGYERQEPAFDFAAAAPAPQLTRAEVESDVEKLQMSTLSFQDYVRQRMLKRREAELAAEASATPAEPEPVPGAPGVSPIAAARSRLTAARQSRDGQGPAAADPLAGRDVPVLREVLREIDADTQLPQAVQPPLAASPIVAKGMAPVMAPVPAAPAASRVEQQEMMGELRSMRGLIEQRFGALAFMEKLQRHPRQAQLSQRLLDAGFSPALIRQLVHNLPTDMDESTWAAGVLERNLLSGEREQALEDTGGVFALIGATGVGKTTSTAKLAAAFAARHGAAELGLVTLDAYRVGAQEQLRTYGRILGVPVHTAHDRASLDDLLDLLAAKRMVLIDTAGMAQRDARTRELLEMVSHRSIQKLLVLNASAQGETIEDQIAGYAATQPGTQCRGVVLSKIDEAVKLGPALDALIRHRLKVLAVANGQRVPEDWHRLSANALVQRALKAVAAPAWRLDAQEVNLVFAGLPAANASAAGLAAAAASGLRA
jgi:flagellar biosynthesis protein FlhF